MSTQPSSPGAILPSPKAPQTPTHSLSDVQALLDKIMDTDPSDALATELVVQLSEFAQVSTDEEDRLLRNPTILCKLGEYLRYGKPETLPPTARILSFMACERPNRVAITYTTALVEAMAHVLRGNNSDEAKSEIALVFGNLAFDADLQRKIAVSRDIVSLLAALLLSSDKQSQHHAVLCLGNLCLDPKSCDITMSTSGVLRNLVKLLRQSEDLQVQEFATRAIANMAVGVGFLPDDEGDDDAPLAQPALLKGLLHTITVGTIEAKRQATIALINLTAAEKAREILCSCEPPVIPLLGGLLKPGKQNNKHNNKQNSKPNIDPDDAESSLAFQSCVVLGNLALSVVERQRQIVGLPSLLPTLELMLQLQEYQQDACGIIRNLASGCLEAQERLAVASLLKHLAQLLGSCDPEKVEVAALAIGCLVEDSVKNERKVAAVDGVVPALRRVVNSQTENFAKARARCTNTLVSLGLPLFP